MTEPVPDIPSTSEPGELVVDLPYLKLVRDALLGNGLQIEEIDRVEEFDLVLLRLTEGNNRAADLDAVLNELRWAFTARFGGWLPAMGKNRTVAGQIGGFPQPRSMAGGDPEPIPATEAPTWDLSSELGLGVRVGILDTKIHLSEQLAGRVVLMDQDAELVHDSTESIGFRAGHATFIAGLILQQAPAAKVHVRWVLDEVTGKTTVWDAVRKLARFAADGEDRRVDVLSLSFGCRTSDGIPPLVLRRAIERLSRDMVVVAAAGNHGEVQGLSNGITRRSPTWPAAMSEVMAAGAERPEEFRDPERAFFSPDLPWVTVTAPGADSRSTFLSGPVKLSNNEVKPFEGYARWSGTSFAAAAVSGEIAAKAQPGKAHHALHDILSGRVESVVRPYRLPT